jgi:hypothetical protein
MARRKTTQDAEWDQIFDAISFDVEPDPKYIKEATIRTVSGKQFKLNGTEFHNVMEQERMLPPEEAVVASCKVKLDLERIKSDVNQFVEKALRKVTRQHVRSTRQKQLATRIRKLARPTQEKNP